MRRIFLERLRVLASVGILAHELRAKQPLLVTMVVDLPESPLLPERDEVDCVLDYRKIRQLALDEINAGHVNMLETLAGRILDHLLAFPQVGRALVRVDKPNIFPDCDGVGVEVERSRST